MNTIHPRLLEIINDLPIGFPINNIISLHQRLEFKRSSDRDDNFLSVKEDEAHGLHKSIIEALKAAAFQQINFVAGRCGVVVEDGFYNKRKKLNVRAGKKDKILLEHVQRICEEHGTEMRSY